MNTLNLDKTSIKTIKTILKNLTKNVVVYEADSSGILHNNLYKNENYIYSDYFPNSGLERYFDVLYEDLHNLSFKNQSIDLLITQDVYEHVRNPKSAFEEIHRVLKTNGIHIFTVPIYQNKTVKRIDENDTILVEPVQFHLDWIEKDRSKVYTDWGMDILDYLAEVKFKASFLGERNPRKGFAHNNLIILSQKIE